MKPTEAYSPLPSGKPTDALPPGGVARQLARYRILKLLGKGGMGEVYLAHDPQLDRHIALKVPHFRPEEEAKRQRFYREARAAATLTHPHICPVYEVGDDQGRPYLTMAFIEGHSLDVVIKQGGPQGQRQVAQLVRKLALALQEAHAKGVVHRDLKPANIMLNLRKEPVIMDFGLAKRAEEGADQAPLTLDGAVMGTPAYMPPEQAEGNQEAIGPRSDIYSLGIILFELLTARRPFEGTMPSVFRQVLHDEPPPPSRFRADLAPELEAICLKAMAKQAAARYSSMAELAAALTDYLRAEKSTPASVATPMPSRPPSDLVLSKIETINPFAAITAAPTLSVPPPLRRRTAQGRHRRVLQVTGVVATAVLLVGIAYSTRRDPTISTGTRPITDSPQPVAARPQPVASSSPLPRPWLRAPDLRQATALFQDNFDDPRSKWPATPTGGLSRSYKNGRFVVRRNGRAGFSCIPGPWTVQECVCEAVGRSLGKADSAWGIELNNYQHKCGVGVYLNGQGEVWLHPTFTQGMGLFPEPHRNRLRHPAIKTGEQFNTLLVVARSRRVEVYVNGVAVCEPLTVDFAYLPAKLDLLAATQVHDAAEFEQLTVWPANDVLPPEQRWHRGDTAPAKDAGPPS